jgi:hypothetical protein
VRVHVATEAATGRVEYDEEDHEDQRDHPELPDPAGCGRGSGIRVLAIVASRREIDHGFTF